MKKITFVKETIQLVTLAACVLLLASCDYNQKKEDTKEVAEEHNDAKFNNDKQEKDAEFLVNAAEINLEEIQLGQLAQDKGKTAHVKQLGKMMEEVHTKSQRDLTALAGRKRISIPTSPTEGAKDVYQELNEKSADDFDKAYTDKMVSRHKEAIEAFEEASTDCYDAEIKNWAKSTLPDLRTHLDHSINSQKKFGTMYFEDNK